MSAGPYGQLVDELDFFFFRGAAKCAANGLMQLRSVTFLCDQRQVKGEEVRDACDDIALHGVCCAFKKGREWRG